MRHSDTMEMSRDLVCFARAHPGKRDIAWRDEVLTQRSSSSFLSTGMGTGCDCAAPRTRLILSLGRKPGILATVNSPVSRTWWVCSQLPNAFVVVTISLQ